MKTIQIDAGQADRRLDKFLRAYFPNLALSAIYRMLRKKQVKVNGKRTTKGEHKVQEGDEVELYVSDEVLTGAEKLSEELFEKKMQRVKPTFTVLYEDDDLLAVNKPGNIAVHSGTSVGFDNLINQVLTYLDYRNKGFKPALIHRLDQETSGIVLIGKSREAVVKLSEAMKNRTVDKKYVALVFGILPEKKGVIKARLERQYKSDSKFKVRETFDEEEGQEAVTNYTVLHEWADQYSLLELGLETGRTHQIRAHLFTIEHPILGDANYGSFALNRRIKQETGLKRQFLHAYKMSFKHPVTGKPMTLVCPLPPELTKTLEFLQATYAAQKNYSFDLDALIGEESYTRDGVAAQ